MPNPLLLLSAVLPDLRKITFHDLLTALREKVNPSAYHTRLFCSGFCPYEHLWPFSLQPNHLPQNPPLMSFLSHPENPGHISIMALATL